MTEINPDTIAFAVVLQVLVRRLARLEMTTFDGAMQRTIPDEVQIEIGKQPIPSVDGVEAIRLRVLAQAMAEHLLAGLDVER